MSFEHVQDHREYLIREYQMRLGRNPHYSQRAFARDLGLSSSGLNDFLKNKLKFSLKRLTDISKKLSLTAEQTIHWTDLCELRFTKSALQKRVIKNRIQLRINDERNNITVEQFKVISEWQYMAILELIQINPQMYSSADRIAKKLDLTLSKTKESLKRLQEVGLLKINSDRIFQVCESTFVNNNIPSSAIRNFHYQIMSKAQDALEKQPMDKRYNSSVMIGIPQNKVLSVSEEINQMIVKILEPYSKIDSEAKNIQLYCLATQFFNLTNDKDKA